MVQAPELAFFVFTRRALNIHTVVAMNAPLGEPLGFTCTLSALIVYSHWPSPRPGPGHGQMGCVVM